MTSAIVFDGPEGDYSPSLPEVTDFEGQSLHVSGPLGESDWHIETAEISAEGVVTLSGLTRGRESLWFVLWLGQPAEISYWADRVVVRTDRAR